VLRLFPLAPLLGALALSLAVHTALTRQVVTPRGEGASAISGVTITGIDYLLGASDPTSAIGVRFVVFPALAGGALQVSVDDRTWSSCRVDGDRATCSFVPAVPVRALKQLRVVAS
jgi:membrane protein implicated in regulation of membrane protease activity